MKHTKTQPPRQHATPRQLPHATPHPRRASPPLALLLAGCALAQTAIHSPYVLTTYDIEQLATRPGTIVIGTRMSTRIEFDDLIEDVDSARQDLFTAEVKDNRIVLRAEQNAGLTDLVVTVGGRTALFVLKIDSELSVPRRYVVGVVPEPAPRTSHSDRTKLLQFWTQTPALTGDTPPTGKAPNPPDDGLPDWLSFQAEATYAPNGLLAIRYTLGNFGRHTLANDAARLRLQVHDPVAGTQKLPFTLSRVSDPGTINRLLAGGIEFGTLLVPDAPGGRVTLEWPLVEIGPGRTYTLRSEFDDGLLRTTGR
ncbi:MAG TPA: hypothetical protein VF171_06875 [Trueperaceae bacterium]